MEWEILPEFEVKGVIPLDENGVNGYSVKMQSSTKFLNLE